MGFEIFLNVRAERRWAPQAGQEHNDTIVDTALDHFNVWLVREPIKTLDEALLDIIRCCDCKKCPQRTDSRKSCFQVLRYLWPPALDSSAQRAKPQYP